MANKRKKQNAISRAWETLDMASRPTQEELLQIGICELEKQYAHLMNTAHFGKGKSGSMIEKQAEGDHKFTPVQRPSKDTFLSAPMTMSLLKSGAFLVYDQEHQVRQVQMNGHIMGKVNHAVMQEVTRQLPCVSKRIGSKIAYKAIRI